MDIRDVNIALCREHLHPRNAKLAERDVLTLVPLTDVEELNVEWGPFSTPSNFPQFKEFLRFFTWPTNADHPKIAKSFVEGDAPDFVAMVIQGEQFRDRWRMVAIRERKEEIRPGEIQYFLKLTLRKGWATSLAEDEARLGVVRGNATSGRLMITRFWANIATNRVEDLTTALKAVKTVTDPQIFGVAKAGTFDVGEVSGNIPSEDGSGRIEQTFITPYGEGVVLEYLENCDTKVKITFQHDLSEADVEALDDAYASASTAGVSVNIRSIPNPDTGMYDAVITTRTRQYRTYSDQAVAISHFEASSEWKQFGLTSQTKRSMTGAAGKIKVQSTRVLPDCSKDVVTVERTSTADAEVRKDKTITPFETDIILTAQHEVSRETEQSVQGANSVKTTSSAKNEFGRFDNSVRTRTATKDVASGTDAVVNKFEESATVKVTHDDAAEATGVQSDGTVVSVENALDEFGEFTTAKRTRTANVDVAAGTDASIDAFRSVAAPKIVHDQAAEDTGVHSAGTSVSVVNDLDEFGHFTTRKLTDTAIQNVAAGTDDYRTPFETRTTTKVKNDSAAETHPGQVDGTVKDVRNDTTRYGLTDTAVVNRVAIKDVASGTDAKVNKFETSANVKVTHDDAVETTGVQSDGTVVEVANKLDEFGEFTTAKSTRTATKDVASGSDYTRTAFEKRQVDKVVHDDEAEAVTGFAEAAFTAGSVEDVRNALDEFGEFTTAKLTRTPQMDVAAGTDARINAFEEDSTVKVVHDAAAEETGVQAAGSVVEVKNQLDDFGEFTTAKRTRTATKDVAAGTDAKVNAFEASATVKIVHDDAAETTGAQTAGTVVDVENALDEFGEFTTAKTTRTATKDVAAGTDTGENLFESTETAKVVHDDAAETQTFVAGTVIDVKNQLDEFGEFTTAKHTRTAKAVAAAKDENIRCPGYIEDTTTAAHQEAAIGAPTSANGHILTNADIKDEFGKYTTVTTDRETNDQSITAFASIKAPGYSETREVMDASAAALALTEDYGSISYKKGPDGRFYGVKNVRTYTGGVVVHPTDKTGLTRLFYQTQSFPGTTAAGYEKTKWREWTYTYDLDYFVDESAAIDATDGSKGGPHMQARTWQSMPGLWCALSITSVQFGTWTAGALS